MKKLLLCPVILLMLIFSACQQQVNAQSLNDVGEAPDTVQIPEQTLFSYLTELTDWEKVLDLECTLSRDDKGIQIEAAPVDVEILAKCLLEIELVPHEETKKQLDIPHPFTLTFQKDGKKETISVTSEKISISGKDYFPTNTIPLAEFFKEDDEGFLTGDIYC